MPAMLWQHDAEEPIGIWTEMSEDKNGLKIKGQLSLETTRGKEAHALVKMGALNGLSIGFVSKAWEYDKEKETRTLTEIDLWEVSVVTFPANSKARVTSVKRADVAEISTIRQAEKALRDAGFSDDAAKAFVAQVKLIATEERDARDAAIATQNAANRLLKSLTT
jgi:HK97 family phage prohead protease